MELPFDVVNCIFQLFDNPETWMSYMLTCKTAYDGLLEAYNNTIFTFQFVVTSSSTFECPIFNRKFKNFVHKKYVLSDKNAMYAWTDYTGLVPINHKINRLDCPIVKFKGQHLKRIILDRGTCHVGITCYAHITINRISGMFYTNGTCIVCGQLKENHLKL